MNRSRGENLMYTYDQIEGESERERKRWKLFSISSHLRVGHKMHHQKHLPKRRLPKTL